MQPPLTQQFSAISFAEKKAMLDFAHEQMEEFAGLLTTAKCPDADGKLQAKFDKWMGIRNALTLACETHLEKALSGPDSSLPAPKG